MNIESAFFEKLSGTPRFEVRVHVSGSGLELRAVPILARVGDQALEEIMIAPGGNGFSGSLAKTPKQGDRLFVRYADGPELDTSVIFGQQPNV